MYGGTILGGQYTVTWNGVALGLMQGDEGVPTIVTRASARMVENTDGYGDGQLGGHYRGVRGRAMMRCLEYTAGVIAAMHPWGTDGAAGVVGRDLYDLAQSLVLTRVVGQSASLVPATVTALKALQAPDADVTQKYGPLVREAPLEFVLFLNGAAPGVLYTKT